MALNIKLIKLLSSEELLAEVVLESEKTVVIKNPLKLALIPSKTDPKIPTMALMRWADLSDDKQFTLDKFHIVVIMSPIKELVNQYNSAFGGIVQPSSGLVIPGT